MYLYNSGSVIKRSRAERKKLGIKRVATPKVAATPPPPSVEPVPEPESDIVNEILQESPKTKPPVMEKAATDCPSGDRGVKGASGVKSEPPKIKKKPVKKKAAKKPEQKKTNSRGKNVKVAELDQEELSDLFSGPTATVDDDDDE